MCSWQCAINTAGNFSNKIYSKSFSAHKPDPITIRIMAQSVGETWMFDAEGGEIVTEYFKKGENYSKESNGLNRQGKCIASRQAETVKEPF